MPKVDMFHVPQTSLTPIARRRPPQATEIGPLEGCPVKERHAASYCEQCLNAFSKRYGSVRARVAR